MHVTFTKLGLPGSKTKKLVIERQGNDTKGNAYQLQLDLKANDSKNL